MVDDVMDDVIAVVESLLVFEVVHAVVRESIVAAVRPAPRRDVWVHEYVLRPVAEHQSE